MLDISRCAIKRILLIPVSSFTFFKSVLNFTYLKEFFPPMIRFWRRCSNLKPHTEARESKQEPETRNLNKKPECSKSMYTFLSPFLFNKPQYLIFYTIHLYYCFQMPSCLDSHRSHQHPHCDDNCACQYLV